VSDEEGRSESSRFWRTVGIMSSLGWSLVAPIVGGALLGHYLDRLTNQGVKWTVGLLFVGVAMSLYNLYQIMVESTKK
jgi:ATP synthase protein I